MKNRPTTLFLYLYNFFLEQLEVQDVQKQETREGAQRLANASITSGHMTLQFAECTKNGMAGGTDFVMGHFQSQENQSNHFVIWTDKLQESGFNQTMAKISAPPMMTSMKCHAVEAGSFTLLQVEGGPIFLHPTKKLPSRFIQRNDKIFLATWEYPAPEATAAWTIIDAFEVTTLLKLVENC